jgi:hypothetical protein
MAETALTIFPNVAASVRNPIRLIGILTSAGAINARRAGALPRAAASHRFS